MKLIDNKWLRSSLVYFGISLALSVFCYIYVSSEHPVYTWDSRFYWVVWNEYFDLLDGPLLTWLKSVGSTIYSDDYNALPIIFLLPFHYLPIGNRESYIIGIYILYMIPFSYLAMHLFWIACKFDSKYRPAVFALFASFVTFLAPSLRGYPDVIAMIPIAISCILVFNTDITRLAPTAFFLRAMTLGFMLWSAFGMRRWYAYTVVSLYLTLPFISIFLRKSIQEIKKGFLIKVLAFYLLAGVTSVACALVFQHALIERILTTSYSEIYSAYKKSESRTIAVTMFYIGFYLLPLALAEASYGILGKIRGLRFLTAFALVNLILTYVIFTRTQTPGVQHAIPLGFWFLILILSSLFLLIERASKAIASCTIVLFSGLIATVFTFTFTKPFGVIAFDNHYFPTKSYPLNLDNFENYLNLISFIRSQPDSSGNVSIFASSGSLNYDLMYAISDKEFAKRIPFVSQVDLRDKLTLDAFMSRYAVVTDPPQVHLGKDGQQVIYIPNDMILKGVGIGSAYHKISDAFVLNNEIRAYVYEKTRPLSISEYRSMIEALSKTYPEWLKEYENSLSESYVTAKVTKGDTWGQFSMYSEGKIFAHPGASTPTIINMFVGKYSTLKFKSVNRNCGITDGVSVTISAGELSVRKHIDTGDTASFDMRPFNDKEVTIVIDNNGSSACDALDVTE